MPMSNSVKTLIRALQDKEEISYTEATRRFFELSVTDQVLLTVKNTGPCSTFIVPVPEVGVGSKWFVYDTGEAEVNLTINGKRIGAEYFNGDVTISLTDGTTVSSDFYLIDPDTFEPFSFDDPLRYIDPVLSRDQFNVVKRLFDTAYDMLEDLYDYRISGPNSNMTRYVESAVASCRFEGWTL